MESLAPRPVGGSLRVLSPADRPVRPFARWHFYLMTPALILNAIAHWTGSLRSVATASTLLAIVGACAFASRAEDRVYLSTHRWASWLRVLLGATLPVVALVGSAVLAALLDALLGWAGADGWVGAVVAGGFWFAGAAAGSFVIVVIDLVVSKAVAGFRARLTVAILCMLALSFVVALAGAIGFLAIVDAVRSGGFKSAVRVDADPERVRWLLAWMSVHPIAVACAVYGVSGLIGTPSALSASAKLAEAVMDRIHPLTGAFDAIARGERNVRVEEGGSRDFVLLSRRFNQMVEGLALAERMERAFGSYVSAPLLERIRAQHGEAVVPASLRDATVFFADIRGFTSMSEKHPPDVVVSILNRYFEHVIALIAEHQGYLNKFIGDAVVVVFNGPVDQPDHAERAARCAIALQALVRKLNASGVFPEVGALHVGVGVSTGPMVCGNVGSAQQMEYTVIGDTVNLAARLTSLAGPGEVWVSEPTARALPEDIARTTLEAIQVKGKSERVLPHRLRLSD